MQQQIVCRADRHHATSRPSGPRTRTWPMQKLHHADARLRQRLCHSLAVREQVVDSVLAVCPSLVQEQQVVDENLDLLHSLPGSSLERVRRLVLSTPCLLEAPLQSWHDFLTAYGLDSRQVWGLLARQPGVLLGGSVFKAGQAIMFLRQLGWSDLEVRALVIQHPQHCAILTMDVDTQLHPVLQYLTQDLGLSTAAAAAAFLHQHPQLWYSQTYQQDSRQLLRRHQLMQHALV